MGEEGEVRRNESNSGKNQEMRKMTKFEEEGGFKIILKFKMGSVLNVKRLSNGNVLGYSG